MKRKPRFGSLTVGASVFRGRLTSAPAAALIIFVATLLTALFVSAVPRVIERVSEDDLRADLRAAEPEQRNISVEDDDRIGAGPVGDPFGLVAGRGERALSQRFPDSVKSIAGDTQYVVDTPWFRVTSFPDDVPGPFPTTFRFHYQQGLEERMTLIAGSLPEVREPIPMLFGGDCPADRLAVDEFELLADVDCFVADVPVFEAAVTSETAAAMMLEIGDQAFLRPDAQDQLWHIGTTADEHTFVLAISGLVELSDISEEYWYADAALHRPGIVENPDFRFVAATGVMEPDRYGQMIADLPAEGFRYMWRYFVDPDRVEGTRAEELRADVARIVPSDDERITTFLDDMIDAHLDQRTLTVRLMSTSVTGVLVAAVGVVLALATLIADRQSDATVLVRDRGASRAQLALTAFYTGLLLVVPSTLLGYMVTTIAFPNTEALASGRGSAVLAFGGTAAVALSGSPYVFRRLGTLQRRDMALQKTTGRRVVMEVFVLVAAVASVALLRRRGIAEPFDGIEADFDMLLAAAPAVIGLAAGLMVLRLMTPLIRLLSWLGSLGRDAVAFVGFRRLLSLPSAAHAPTAVVLLAVAIAVFSSVVRTAIDEGQDRHTWQVVGADYRIEGPSPGVPLPGGVDPEQLARGGSWAEAAELPGTSVSGLARAPQVTVLAIDAAAYEDLLAGSGSEVPQLRLLAAGDDSERRRPAPALVSSHWGAEGAPTVGTEFALEIGSVDPDVVVAGVLDSFPSLPAREPFVVIGFDELRRFWSTEVAATILYLGGSASEGTRLAESLANIGGRTVLLSRYQTGIELAGDPLSLWVDRGLGVIFYLALTFAIVAALSLLTVTANRRRRDLGYLRTIGLTIRQATLMTALEQIPPLTVATLMGAVTGGVVAKLLAPALDIGSFTGGLVPAEIVVEPLPILVLAVLMALLIGAAVITFVAFTRDEDYGKLLKVGDD
jgi:putative ABC transport system permease protein